MSQRKLEDKVYSETYYNYQLGSVVIDETQKKNQNIRIADSWMDIN
jgi:hypothetical protein